MWSHTAVSRAAAVALLAALTLTTGAPAQSPAWVNQFGSPFDDVAFAIASDDGGGAFVCAYVGGNTLLRLDAAGSIQWAVSLNGRVRSAAEDGAGGVIVSGDNATSGVYDVDFYVARYDGAGNQLWERTLGTPQAESWLSITADGSGGVFGVGNTDGSYAASGLGGMDVVVLRMDGAGNQLWAHQFGTAGLDFGTDIASDGTGGAFVSGDLDGGALNGDACFAHYGGAGTQSWLHRYPKDKRTGTFARIAADGAGGAFVAGAVRKGAQQFDVWIGRFDDRGRRLWSRSISSAGRDLAKGLAPDGQGGVYLAGGLAMDRASGALDGFVAHYDRKGRSSLLLTLPSTGLMSEDIFDLTSDGAGGFLIAGTTGALIGDQALGLADAWAASYPGW